ncbi:MAG: hypothetical protein LBD01_03480 [Puniceicoccales bacterium]|jgi:DNA polymerase-1|nr:hypothetical protein [Puniceicoccales bacterium]
MKYVLVDGFNLAFRMFHGMPVFSRRDGLPVNAIMGWVRSIWKLQELETPCTIAVFFDKAGSRRHLELHEGYKAHRPEMPEALARQIPFLKEVTPFLGARVVEEEGVEADDLIASAARALAAQGSEVRIASSDKDFAQCVDAHVHLLIPTQAGATKAGWAKLDAVGVQEKFGVPPEKIVDLLSLTGDAVDNIPGVPGVGPKTALAWLLAYGDIAGLLTALDKVEPARFREVLAGARELLRLNQQLIRFRSDFAVDCSAPAKPDDNAARAFFERMEMRAILKTFDQRAEAQLELFE